jgi:glycosyltransferase involved in cell wall biosynthesis
MSRTLPFFSIIIPTLNRPKALERCLEALSDLDYPRDCFEVIVVDDGSVFSLENIVELFCDRLEITLCDEPHAGPAAARNKGVSRAKGEFLAFTDDDCRPDRRWLRFLAGCLEADPDSIVGGRTINALIANAFSTASQIVVDYLYDYYQNISTPSFTTNNLALTRRTFQGVGGFDTGFPFAAGEDREFCGRALSQGKKLVFCSNAVIYHWHRLTFAGFWRQHFRYGQGAFWFREKVGGKNKSLEPLMFYINLVLSPFIRRSQWPVLMFGLLIVSQAANALGFFKQKLMSYS